MSHRTGMIKLTPAQFEQAAQEYCRIRTEQDGGKYIHDWRTQIEIAQIAWAWHLAFQTILSPEEV